MAEVRIRGDRVYEDGSAKAVPDGPPGEGVGGGVLAFARKTAIVRPAAAASTNGTARDRDERRRIVIESTPVGEITIHPTDYARRLPAYETAARDVCRLPVVRVWEIVHSSRLRAAVVLESIEPTEYTVYLNVLRTQCVVHRLASFEHELEHVRRGDCGKAEDYNEAMERPCEAASDRQALVVAELAAARESRVSIDVERCRTCNANSEAPCPQGADVFAAVNRALAPL